MGTSLSGLTPGATYTGLLKFGDNAAISGTLKAISDGAGTDTMLSLSTTALQIGGATGLNWDNTNNRLGVGTNTPVAGPLHVKTTTANANGSIIFGNNSAATILAATDTGSALTQLQFRASSYNFADSTGLLIGGTYGATPTAMLQVKGSGTTSGTTSLLVQNSAGSTAFRVYDDLSVGLYSSSQLCMNSAALPNNNGGLRFLNLGSGNTYIDGWSDGTSKAQNYPLVIGSRVNNFGSAITGSTTTENGTPVVFGSDVYNASAVVQINSTTRGFLPPRMTTTQKNAIASPAAGLVLYDSTTNKLQCYNGSTWNDLF